MKIYIVGSGGVGGYFGGLMAKAGFDVTFVARGEHFKAIKNDGLRVKSIKSGDFIIKPCQVIQSIKEISNPDVILFTVKTYDTEEAARQLNEVVDEKTVIITFQNGVENDFKIKQFISKSKVFPGVAYIISTKIKPGIIEQIGGMGRLIIGARENSMNNLLKPLGKIMKDSKIDVVLSEDISQDIWKKFVFISAFSGITALYRKPIGEIIKDKKIKNEYENCVKETIKTAKALNINLPENIFELTIEVTRKTNPNSKSSLLVDVERGEKNEIETLNGMVVKYAKKFNIEAPVNNKIYSSIRLQ